MTLQACAVALFFALTALAGFIIVLCVAVAMIDGIAQYSEQHDACLKHATNGYEIERCH